MNNHALIRRIHGLVAFLFFMAGAASTTAAAAFFIAWGDETCRYGYWTRTASLFGLAYDKLQIRMCLAGHRPSISARGTWKANNIWVRHVVDPQFSTQEDAKGSRIDSGVSFDSG